MTTVSGSSKSLMPAVLVKEYAYCPRYAYFMLFLNGVDRITESMRSSLESHVEHYRDVVINLCNGYSVYFEYHVGSNSLGIHGVIDAVCVGEEVIVVDLKPLSRVTKRSLMGRHRHFLYQVVAYSMIAEEVFKRSVKRAYILAKDGPLEIRITPALKREVVGIINELRRMIMREDLPRSMAEGWKCNYCVFKRFCLPMRDAMVR